MMFDNHIKENPFLGFAGFGGGISWDAVQKYLDAVYVDDVFSTFVYDGNGNYSPLTGINNIVNGIDLDGEGGLVWGRARFNATSYSHALFDTERGVSKVLSTDNNNPEATYAGRGVTAFNSDGFTLTSNLFGENQSGAKCVSWTFRKAPGFFDVVAWTGDGTSERAISHNLGSVPGCIILKRTDISESKEWIVYHVGAGTQVGGWPNFLKLNSTAASFGDSGIFRPNDVDGSYLPTSEVVNISTDFNASGGTYVAYFFAHDDQSFGTNSDEAIIKCGVYNANNDINGNTIDVGFEPQWLLIKSADIGGLGYGWTMHDNIRDRTLSADSTNQENNARQIDFTSTGFRCINKDSNINDGTGQYIYIAIRRPHKPVTDATEVFDTNLVTTGTPTTTFTSGFVTDAIIYPFRTLGAGPRVSSRLTGNPYLDTSSNGAEAGTTTNWDSMTGLEIASSPGNSLVDYMFRRAPGFFDVVAYTGTGSATTVSHNLGVAPEMIICKKRTDNDGSGTGQWCVYHSALGTNKVIQLNSFASFTSSDYFPNSHTSSAFAVGTQHQVNGNGSPLIAYLFATLPGISKVGSYTGTGTTLDVNCGFTAGARFVLIKRTDSTGDWYTYDSARGIVGGNDPYLLLNDTAAEVTGTDYIDPLNAGFTVTSSAPDALNAVGGTYIFLAIA